MFLLSSMLPNPYSIQQTIGDQVSNLEKVTFTSRTTIPFGNTWAEIHSRGNTLCASAIRTDRSREDVLNPLRKLHYFENNQILLRNHLIYICFFILLRILPLQRTVTSSGQTARKRKRSSLVLFCSYWCELAVTTSEFFSTNRKHRA